MSYHQNLFYHIYLYTTWHFLNIYWSKFSKLLCGSVQSVSVHFSWPLKKEVYDYPRSKKTFICRYVDCIISKMPVSQRSNMACTFFCMFSPCWATDASSYDLSKHQHLFEYRHRDCKRRRRWLNGDLRRKPLPVVKKMPKYTKFIAWGTIWTNVSM